MPVLIPDYLTALEVAETHRADLDAQLKTATAKPDDEDADADDVSADLSTTMPSLRRHLALTTV